MSFWGDDDDDKLTFKEKEIIRYKKIVKEVLDENPFYIHCISESIRKSYRMILLGKASQKASSYYHGELCKIMTDEINHRIRVLKIDKILYPEKYIGKIYKIKQKKEIFYLYALNRKDAIQKGLDMGVDPNIKFTTSPFYI